MIRLRFVQDHRIEFSVERMCTLVEVPRSSFYEWSTRLPSAREQADAELLEIIIEIHEGSRRTYGIPRVLGQLHRRGIRIARSRVARIMRTNGLQGAHARRKWKRHRHDGDPTEDLLNRDFIAEVGPSKVVQVLCDSDARVGQREASTHDKQAPAAYAGSDHP